MSNNAAQQTQEVEITLLVCSDNAPRAAQRVAELNVIGPYRLVSRGARSISDTYLDTSDHRLYRHQLSLRVRRVDGETFITFKGPAEQLPWGGASRLEIEVPWSEAALQDILPRLEIRGLEPARMIPIAAADPLETLADLGLQPIQARENQRQVRDLIPQAGPLRAVAELVIDSVTYRFGDTVVRHLEVEIESKLPGDNSALEVASRRLLADYAPELRVWPYGKLTTGAAVQELLEQGSLARHIGPGGYLLPGAYTAIEQLLGRR